MVEVSYHGKQRRQFAGTGWKPGDKKDIADPRHLDYYSRHAEFKVHGAIPPKKLLVKASVTAPGVKAKASKSKA